MLIHLIEKDGHCNQRNRNRLNLTLGKTCCFYHYASLSDISQDEAQRIFGIFVSKQLGITAPAKSTFV
jgi:hypothetical protein